MFVALFVGPGVACLQCAFLLGERVTAARTALPALGFAGVLMVVRPGSGAPEGIGFGLLAGILHGAYLASTRWLAGTGRPGIMLASSSSPARRCWRPSASSPCRRSGTCGSPR